MFLDISPSLPGTVDFQGARDKVWIFLSSDTHVHHVYTVCLCTSQDEGLLHVRFTLSGIEKAVLCSTAFLV